MALSGGSGQVWCNSSGGSPAWRISDWYCPHAPVLWWVRSRQGPWPQTEELEWPAGRMALSSGRGLAQCNSSAGGAPNLKSFWLGRPACASALVSPIPPGTVTVTADCITWMASRLYGPVLWQRPGTVQQQRGPSSLKSFWLGRPASASALVSGRHSDSSLYNLNGQPAVLWYPDRHG